MSAGDAVMLSPSRKRPTPDGDFDEVTTPHKMPKTSQSENDPQPTTPATHSLDQTEPTSVASTSALSDQRPSQPASAAGTPSKASTKQLVKKRTKAEMESARVQKEAEKAQREAEKQAKLLEKEEKKRKKDEEDRVKEDERRVKEEEKKKKQAEKDEKKQQKEQERLAKEAEKQKKIDEQQKKERAQLKLVNFFAAKPTTTLSSRTVEPSSCRVPSDNVASKLVKQATTDFEATFLPFNVPKNGRLGPINFHVTHSDPEDTVISLADIVRDDHKSKRPQFSTRSKVQEHHTALELIRIVQGTANDPIDLTSQEYGRTLEQAFKILNNNLTYLEFHEDVRPPFCGVFNKSVSEQDFRRIKRNPCHTKVAVLNYEYDSEAEWEEPEEGEDIIGEDDDDESDEGDDDMEGFIDDEGNADPLAAKRPAYVRDLPPISSGLQWQDCKGALCAADTASSAVDWNDLQMEFLLIPEPTCIDPFSHQYWEVPKTTSPLKNGSLAPGMAPTHRPALSDKTRRVNGLNSAVPQVFKVLRMIPSEDMDAFKAAIDGQELTKVAMREHLKKLFPKHNKEAINNTLDSVAERESKKATAKWRLKTT